ncbi:hypothetical protein ASD15_27645 [Massilia sp. Root351]|uniref:prepilin-type N-terminal cleavage/methylation domain-containing protein n=1 Tax=Massilia sp. Root351 TaxID=1736522 RepID=UPI00070AA55C|nr:prepilin-type N-terminal cleavage/methylation domain-containing protein [Massilia sp. Root351]KQV87830.1 hypothetical protein ASD15_27645 [Massilia sp. Root351]
MSINRRQRGLTMIELIIFIVIVGVAVVGILQVLSLNTRSSADPARRKQAMAIAEGLMEEVRQAAFTWCDFSDPLVEEAAGPAGCTTRAEGPGPEPGAVRPFDNVNDYGSANGAPVPYTTDVTGNAFPAGYNATVTVASQALATVPAGSALRITVSVAYGTESVVLESYRTRYAPNSTPISPKSVGLP